MEALVPEWRLWHHWELSETSGTTAKDTGFSSTQTDGPIAATLMGDATWLVGNDGPGVALDGSGDYLDLGKNVKFSGDKGMTISLWLRAASGGREDV